MRTLVLYGLQRLVTMALFAAAVLFGAAPLSAAAADATHAPLRVAGMSGGMMGHMGMMGGSGQAEPAGEAAPNARAQAAADRLLHYIREQHLACLRCHALSGSGFGPSFRDIAKSAARDRAGAQRLVDSIVNGVGRMPTGLATRTQARKLVDDILRLDGHDTNAGTQ